jgi:hypothetical protein
MSEEIKNRVAGSKLITFDLEDLYPEGNRIELDISQFLFEGILLKEKDFRASVKNHNWEQYQDNYIALTNTNDVLVPAWAFMLLTTHLSPITKSVSIGNLEQLEIYNFSKIIENLDVSNYQDKPIIIKGCSNKPIPENAYLQLIQKLQPIAKSLMYGEACSSVPLFKRK